MPETTTHHYVEISYRAPGNPNRVYAAWVGTADTAEAALALAFEDLKDTRPDSYDPRPYGHSVISAAEATRLLAAMANLTPKSGA